VWRVGKGRTAVSLHVALRYDLRCPAGIASVSRDELYATFLDQAALADSSGIDSLVLSEHHDVDDGYLPSPIPLAAAAAARTERIPIIVAALLVPLYDPVRLAEDMVVTDLVSRGRVAYVCGLGYRPEEYVHAGVDWSQRGQRMEANLRVLRQALTGEPFEYDGRTVRVTPRPHTAGGVPLLYGGGSPAAARRAARLGMIFYPQHASDELARVYREECDRLGTGPGMVVQPPSRTGTWVLSKDPDRFWAHHGQHLLHEAREYAGWQVGLESAVLDTSTTVDQMRAAGIYRVVTPDELVEAVRSGPAEPLAFHPLIGGLDPAASWECLDLLVDTLPRLRDAVA
jgi:alkanesulfonate monooxygenase SsuD/methylene tetrahydromethanopterin reductase-like flavin-dependent oxidoreductase (luciferase family)